VTSTTTSPRDSGRPQHAGPTAVANEPAPAGSTRRIVAVVLNPFLNDTRVLKQARSLRAIGHEVHVVAVWKPGLAFEDEVSGIPVHRVRLTPVGFSMLARFLLIRRPDRMRRRLQDRSAAWQAAGGAKAPETAGGAGSHTAGATVPPPVASIPARAIAKFRAVRRRLRTLATRTLRRLVPTVFYPTLQMGMNLDLAARIAALEPDVVHCHDLNTLIAGMLSSRVRGIPVVYDSHELFLERNIAGRSRFWDRLQWGIVERRLIGRCAAVSTVAEGIADHLRKRYGLDRVELIRNVQPFEPPAPRSHVLADELGIDRDRRIALYAGGIFRHRGLEQMIRAARLADDRIAWVVMGYASEDAYLTHLKDLARGEGVLGTRVYFRDAVPPDAVNEYAASSDLAVVPTEAICLSYEFEASNKIFHSVMARVPVAMSDHIEKRLLNERHHIGVLFDETDPSDIARVVQEFLDDRPRYDAAVEACGRAATVLNWEHEERTLLGMFGRVIEEAAVPR